MDPLGFLILERAVQRSFQAFVLGLRRQRLQETQDGPSSSGLFGHVQAVLTV